MLKLALSPQSARAVALAVDQDGREDVEIDGVSYVLIKSWEFHRLSARDMGLVEMLQNCPELAEIDVERRPLDRAGAC